MIKTSFPQEGMVGNKIHLRREGGVRWVAIVDNMTNEKKKIVGELAIASKTSELVFPL